jgi:hypothetical protein
VKSAPSRSLREPAPAGVIDTIGTAFTILNHRPYLALMVVALDLLLWLGPRISVNEIGRAVNQMLSRPEFAGQSPAPVPMLSAEFDAVVILASLIPSLVAALGPDNIALPYQPLVLQAMLAASIGVVFALFLASIGLGMSYWTILAYVVRGERLRRAQVFRSTLRNTLVMLAYLGLLALAAVGLSFLAGFTVFGATLLGLGDIVLVLFTIATAVLAILFYIGTFFVEDAIVLSGAGPFRAVIYSLGICRIAFWPTMRFIAASLVVQLGLPLALRVFTQNAAAVPFALVSHSYVATGLVLASLLFYRERIVLVLRQGANAKREEESRR